MLKKLILATALFAANASAQQSADISGADFSSGKGDATLAALARQAVASDRRLVITAPQEWHKAIAAKLRAGGHPDIVLRDGFYESVLVRTENKTEAPKPEPEKTPARSAPKAAPVVAAPAPAPAAAPAPRVVEVKPVPTAPVTPAPVAPPPPAPTPAAAPAPSSVTPPPHALATLPAPKSAPAAPVVDVAAIRGRFEQSLNKGRAAQGTLAVAALQSGDAIYVDEPVRAIVRREGIRPTLYWLDGDLDLRRTELKVVAPNRYQVMTVIRGDGSLRREFADSLAAFDAHEPADGAPARTVLERKFNDGKRISLRLDVGKLRGGDIVYTGDGAAVVVRRDGNDLQRYWLDGSLDLRQTSLQPDGANKYRVVNDAVH